MTGRIGFFCDDEARHVRAGIEGDGTVAQQVQRWIEVTPSQFPHEAEGLNIVRSLLPDNAPFRGVVQPGVPRRAG
ncbi:MAG: hypothetical protein ACLPKE_16055 [Streptosporangiaceae bacterium]